MMPTRLVAACVALLLCGIPLIARAGSGDPRLVNGVLEWPAVVTNEQFVIVRGDDGVLYYVGIAAARREAGLTAGSRIAVLGLEGRSPHEVTAIGVGTGSTSEAALVQLQSVRALTSVAPVSAAPPATTVAPATPAPPAAGVAPANANATPAAQKATAPSAPAVRQPDAPSPKSSMIDTRAPASAAAPAVVPASTLSPATAPSPSSTAPMLVPTDEHRWVEITGEVESLTGRTLVLKVDGGRVSVDLSSLRANLERVVTPGSMVKVYGVPVELRFKAMGFIDPDARARAPRPN
jgi:hypothetical protein